MLKVRTLFSGIGAPESALKNLGIEYELVDFCEIDKYAVQSYCAIHGVDESKNLGDISKVQGRDLPYADLLVWGFPCTDISVAGKQAGIIEGETRSGLYYEGLRILRETKPKYSIIENVKNLVGKQFKADFEQMLKDIEKLGYNNYWKVLNAKDYGIPQNRERVFIVSIRADVDKGFEFTVGFDNGLRLKDFLEDEVDEKFYISQEKVEKIINSTFIQEKKMIQNGNGICSTLLARDYKDPKCVPCLTPDRVEKRQEGRRFKEDGDPAFTITSQDRHGILQIGLIEGKNYNQNKVVYNPEGLAPTIQGQGRCGNEPKVLQVGNIIDTGNWDNPQRGRIYSTDGISPALNTVGGGGLEPKIFQSYRIRKLTPKECWRLMGFSDEEFQKAVDAGVSNSQLYKQAGNSIVTFVLAYIFKNLLTEELTHEHSDNV